MEQQPTPPVLPVAPQPPVGQPGQPQPYPPVAVQNPGQTLGIIGLVLGVIGLALIGLPLSIVSIIQSSKAHASNALGIIGVIINALSLLVGLLAILFIVFAATMGVQQRAKTTESTSNTMVVMKKAEAYYTLNEKYPQTIADFESSSETSLRGARLSVSVINTAPTDASSIQYKACGITGAEVVSYDTATSSVVPTYLGDATVLSCK